MRFFPLCSSPMCVLRLWLPLFLFCIFAADAFATPTPLVVASSKPLHSLLSALMQGVDEPGLLIDQPTAPWEYAPDEADRRMLQAAELVVWSGRELEPALAEMLDAPVAGQRVFEALANPVLKVLPARHDENLRDPFFWLDSRNMAILLDALARLLIESDPERAPVYERNWQHMAGAIGEIDRALEFGYRDVSGVPVFFYHDTHQYFQQAYAMHVAGSVATFDAAGYTEARRLLDVRSRMQHARKTCLFTEQALTEPHVELLLSGTGLSAVELDSFGAALTPGPDLYVELMRRNHAKIAGCVRAIRPQVATAAQPMEPDVRQFPQRITPRYLMMDQYGRSVSDRDFRGRFQLINFGYTYCPDVCPTSLAIMSRTMKKLGQDAAQVQPIFITIDPQRDSPEVLREYVAYFDKRMLGLSASPEVTKRTAELFKARFEKVPAEDGDPQRYSMDHTASLYLLGRNGEFITKFAHGLPAAEVAAQIRQQLAQ